MRLLVFDEQSRRRAWISKWRHTLPGKKNPPVSDLTLVLFILGFVAIRPGVSQNYQAMICCAKSGNNSKIREENSLNLCMRVPTEKQGFIACVILPSFAKGGHAG